MTVSPEWAAYANGVAVRELDYHDTYLAADYSHPGDNVPPLLAVAQHVGANGHDLVRGIVTGYEVQIDLVRSISLHRHKIDHVAHLGPSVAAGLGTLLHLDTDVVYQAVNQALHTTTSTRQSRKGQISSWKAFAPALAGKLAVEAVDRAMRGEGTPGAGLRGRGRRHRLAPRRARRPVCGAAAGAGRTPAADPAQLHQGALRRVPGAGVDRPGPAVAGRPTRRSPTRTGSRAS